MGALVEVVKEVVLAAVRGDLSAHKEEVDELQHMLTAVEEKNEATNAAMEERERELAAVKRELAAVKGELAAVKGELAAVKGELAAVKGELAEHKCHIPPHHAIIVTRVLEAADGR
ncbi:unnamed protein product [Closterium sp. Naga37s-1]|nr:unnamed protein product [Closterium sp. Naga37s-1]